MATTRAKTSSAKPKPNVNQFGVETPLTNGEIFDDKELDNYELRRMAQDETISAALDYMTNYVIASIGEYVNENEKIQDYVNNTFENTEKSFRTYLKEIIRNAMIYGWSANEIVWAVNGQNVRIKKFVTFDTSELSIFYGKDKPEYLIQDSYRGRIKIPFEKIFKYSTGPGIFGKSYLVKIYRLWQMKTALLKWWAAGMERFALPLIWGRTKNVVVTKENGEKERAVKLLNERLSGIHSKTAIATDDQTTLSYLSSGIGGSHFSNVFRDAIEYLNILIFRNFGLPNLLLSSQTRSAGAYALGNVHFRMFSNSVKGIASDLTREFVDEVVYKLITYNFGEVDSYGYFHIGDEPNPEQMEQFANAFANLTNTGIIDPLKDGEWIRDYLKLPRVEE